MKEINYAESMLKIVTEQRLFMYNKQFKNDSVCLASIFLCCSACNSTLVGRSENEL